MLKWLLKTKPMKAEIAKAFDEGTKRGMELAKSAGLREHNEKIQIAVDLEIDRILIEAPNTDEKDIINILNITSSQQYPSLRAWFIRNSIELNKRAAIADKDNSYCLTKIAGYLIDLVKELEMVELPKHEPESTDPYSQ
jgi:hypothetical protein